MTSACGSAWCRGPVEASGKLLCLPDFDLPTPRWRIFILGQCDGEDTILECSGDRVRVNVAGQGYLAPEGAISPFAEYIALVLAFGLLLLFAGYRQETVSDADIDIIIGQARELGGEAIGLVLIDKFNSRNWRD